MGQGWHLLKSMARVSLIEKVAFEPRLKRVRGLALQTSGERAAGAMPSDRSSLVIRRHSKKAMRLEK